MEGGDFGFQTFLQRMSEKGGLEFSTYARDEIEEWVRRVEQAAERMEGAASQHAEAASTMQMAARSMNEAAGTMYASRR